MRWTIAALVAGFVLLTPPALAQSGKYPTLSPEYILSHPCKVGECPAPIPQFDQLCSGGGCDYRCSFSSQMKADPEHCVAPGTWKGDEAAYLREREERRSQLGH